MRLVDRSDLDRLALAVAQRARHASWVVLAGSLPPGAPDGWYAELVRALADTGVSVAVDTSGAPLVALAEDAAVIAGTQKVLTSR